MRIRVSEHGTDEAERKLRQLEVALRDLRPFWPKLVPLFIRWMGQQFATEGGWGGSTWAPLSPDYAVWKAARYPGKGILVAEGDLRRAASSPDRDMGPSHLTLTITDPKIHWHQEGTPKMPARPLIPARLPASALVEVERAADEYVDELVDRLGL